jgi:hypothetical protein
MGAGTHQRPSETDAAWIAEQGYVGLDRRALPRRIVGAPSVITFDPGAHSVNCTLRNASAAGARVVLHEDVELPHVIRILDGRGACRDARVIWRVGADIGVEFVG